MKKQLRLIFLLFILSHISGYAQEKSITGTVTDVNGIPLPGVNVQIENTNRGAQTDFDGNYIISASRNEVLVFSFIGLQTVRRTVGDQNIINVIMEEDNQALDEVVVVGYGTSTKESLTGAVEVVGSEQFEMNPVTSFENALQGNVTGLQMSSSDGQPGANAQVRIRGIGSINASSEPLYVIDGIPVVTGSLSVTDFGNGGRSSNIMSTINPNDIASVSVLKDASATAIYGSRGANGVIIVTTKSGKSGKPRINFSSQLGFSNPAYNNLAKPLNAEQYTQLFLEGYVNRGETLAQAQARFDNLYPEPADTNWLESIQRTGITQQYNVDVSGSNNGITYFASASYFDQEGIIIASGFDRFTSRLNLTAKVTDRLTISNNITVGQTNASGAADGTAFDNPLYGAYLVPATIPIYDEEGLFYAEHTNFMMGGANPVGKLLNDDRWMKQTRILDNISASYKIMDNLTFKSAWSFDLINVHEFEYDNGRFGDGRRVGGRANEGHIQNTNWIGTQTLNYQTVFDNVHNFDLLIGYEAQKAKQRSMEAWAEGFPNPTLRTLANAANPTTATSSGTQYSFLSQFSRLSYDFRQKYYATASFRRDGSSRFGEENRWGNFWSLGTSWRIIEEAFMSDINWLDNLKLRASYGVTGNAGIGNFEAMGLYGFGYDYANQPGSAPSGIGNPLLTWEKQKSLDIGFDLTVFDRIRTTATYFIRKNEDLLLDRPLPTTTGFSSNIQNIGDMQNKGVEFEIDAQIIKGSNFNWDLGFNITLLENKITRLEEPIVEEYGFRREEGRDFNEFYMTQWAGVDPQTGRGLWYIDETRTTTTTNFTEAERVYTGKSATPDAFGGVNTSVQYQGFSLSAQLAYSWNNYLYDYPAFVIEGDGRYTPRSTYLHAFENRWTTPGQDATYPQHVWGNTTLSNSKNSTRALYDATYIRLRNVNFSYIFPTSITDAMHITSLKVFVMGNNMLTWTRAGDDLHIDPEASPDGIVDGLMPQLKTLSFGLNIGF